MAGAVVKPPTAQEAYQLADAMLADAAEIARRDPATFVALCLPDDKGNPIAMAPMHEEWHDLISQHRAVVIWGHFESGKSVQLSIGRVLWEIGRNPDLHIGIVSNTSDAAKNILRAIGKHIMDNPLVTRVFPGLMPSRDPAMQWTADALTVERAAISKDPSVRAFGIEALVPGPRLDFVIMDDVLDMDNTRTQGQRDTVWTRLTSTLFTRMTPGSHMVCIGNAWHPDDAMHRMVERSGFHAARFPVLTDRGISWPGRWSHERMEEMRGILGTFEFQRMMLCVARDDATARIKREWVDRCLQRGLGVATRYAFERAPAGRVYTGVDLAVSKSSGADRTAIFTMLAKGDGDREVVNVEVGRWSAQEIIARIRAVVQRYGGIVLVESNAAQSYLQQLAAAPGERTSALPIYPFHTSAKKWDPHYGVESIAAELEAARWVIPARRVGDTLVGATQDINEWISELVAYDPDAHTGDVLMASYLAREAARKDDVAWEPPRISSPRSAQDLQDLLDDPLRHVRPRQLEEGDVAKAQRVVDRKLQAAERARLQALRDQVRQMGLDPERLGLPAQPQDDE